MSTCLPENTLYYITSCHHATSRAASYSCVRSKQIFANECKEECQLFPLSIQRYGTNSSDNDKKMPHWQLGILIVIERGGASAMHRLGYLAKGHMLHCCFQDQNNAIFRTRQHTFASLVADWTAFYKTVYLCLGSRMHTFRRHFLLLRILEHDISPQHNNQQL